MASPLLGAVLAGPVLAEPVLVLVVPVVVLAAPAPVVLVLEGAVLPRLDFAWPDFAAPEDPHAATARPAATTSHAKSSPSPHGRGGYPPPSAVNHPIVACKPPA